VAQGTEAELAALLEPTTAIEVEVKATEEELKGALGELEEVSGHEVLGSSEGWLRARVRAASDVREQVAVTLVSKGFGLRALGTGKSELESIFVRLAQGEGTQAQPESSQRDDDHSDEPGEDE